LRLTHTDQIFEAVIHASYSSPVGQDDVVFATAIECDNEPASATASAGRALIERHEVVHFVPNQGGSGVREVGTHDLVSRRSGLGLELDCGEVLVDVQPTLLALGDVCRRLRRSVMLARSDAKGLLNKLSLVIEEVLCARCHPANRVAEFPTGLDEMRGQQR
jgi:hypothetical protein